MRRWAGRRRWRRSAPGWPRAVFGSCSISCPITPRSIIPGSRRILIFTSRAASRLWRRRRRTIAGSRRTRVPRILAHGRDPNFPGWPDTLQLDYANPALQAAQDGGTAGDCRAMRRRALRHGDAPPAGGLPAHLGPDAGAVLAEGDRGRAPRLIPASPSWPKPIGTSNGTCSSRASTTATTSVFTTGCAMPMPARCAPIWRRGSTIRIGWRASSRTTTSRAPRRSFPGRSIGRPPPSPTSRRGCASSTRAS